LAALIVGLARPDSALADYQSGRRAYELGNFAAAFDQWYAAAAAFDVNAMVALAEFYEAGTSVDPDPLAAAILYRMAEALGRPDALPEFERLVNDLTDNLRSAERLPYLISTFNERLSANIPVIERQAREGNPNAQFVYGALLAEGIGIPKDQRAGYYWLKIAEPSLIGDVVRAHVIESLDHLRDDIGNASQAADLRAEEFQPLARTAGVATADFEFLSRPGFFDDNRDALRLANRLLRVVVLPQVADVFSDPQFLALYPGAAGIDVASLAIEFPDAPSQFSGQALHGGYSTSIVVPDSFLKIVENINDATIATFLETGCAVGAVPGELPAVCDQPERLSSYLSQLGNVIRNDLRRNTPDVIAPHITLVGISTTGTVGLGYNPIAYRGPVMASSLMVLVAHQLGHLVLDQGDNQIAAGAGLPEKAIDEFVRTVVDLSRGGPDKLSLAGVRSAYFVLNIGGTVRNQYVCQTQAFSQLLAGADTLVGDGPNGSCDTAQ